MACSQTPPIGFGAHKRAEEVIFACFVITKKIFVRNQQKSLVKKSFLTNKAVRLGVREKIFELTLDFKICFGKVL